MNYSQRQRSTPSDSAESTLQNPGSSSAYGGQRTTPPQMLLGRYRIMGSCGTGGFGTVLVCWDTRLQRRVAIKRMPLAQGMPSATEATLRLDEGASTLDEALGEARTSSMLSHPNIVIVHDFELEGACAYLVMEYVDGLTLAQLLERVEGGTLTPDEVSYLVEEVAQALAFAHKNGVLHLDIKPSNIMFDRQGQVKICDFGMATLASATGYGGARGGTVGYMPPEQIRGEMVDERCDVFSLGVVCWQALTGVDPFAAPTAQESLAKIERGPRQPLSKLVPQAAGMAEEALDQSLDPLPSRRLSSVEEFAHEVSFGLGDAQAGAASIRQLMGQTDEESDEPDVWEGERLSFAEKHPAIAHWLPRATSACVSAWAAEQLASALPQLSALFAGSHAFAAAAGVLTLLWPPAGSLMVEGALCLSVLFGDEEVAAVLLAPLLLCAVFAWLIHCGRKTAFSSAALLLPSCLAIPASGVALAGTALRPSNAILTSGLAWVLAHVFIAVRSAGPSGAAIARALWGALSSPGSLLGLAGCLLATGICAAISSRHPTTTGHVLGQIAGAALLAFSQSNAARVENGGIWLAPAWETVGVAVVLGVLVSISAFLTGPVLGTQEGDDIDEPA